jgi:hypothetical protein
MHKFGFIIIFAFAASTLGGAAQSGPCESVQGGKVVTQASVFLTVERTKYSLDKSMAIDVGIRNDGRDPVYVYGRIAWGYGGGLVIRIRDASGKEIAPVLRDDTMLPPPRRDDDPGIFVKLEEANFFGTRRDLPVRNLVKTPGKYSLQVEYRSPLSCGFMDRKLQQLPALWHEDESIFSNTVSFEVTR